MNQQGKLFNFVLKEWVLIASTIGLVVTSLYLKRLPGFSISEFQVLFILAILFIAVKGLDQSGLMLRLSQIVEKGRFIPLKLIVITFFLSMLLTNDVALIVIVPLTLILNINRKDILVILEALAANAGSALTPFGNPQNLLIYWFYNIRPGEFVASIAPFSITFLALLFLASLLIKTTNNKFPDPETTKIRRSVFAYAALLLLVILVILHILPIQAGIVVVIYAVLVDRESLRIDYPLLLTFAAFFGLATNVQSLFAASLEQSTNIFIFSALLSQIISNVPAALVFTKFTPEWKALLWGVNVGGFGSLVGSLANLIAYKFYIGHKETRDPIPFTIKFILIGYGAFAIGVLLYWAI